jgi:hypothetical protein
MELATWAGCAQLRPRHFDFQPLAALLHSSALSHGIDTGRLEAITQLGARKHSPGRFVTLTGDDDPSSLVCMRRIDWRDLSPGLFEDMVAVLLSHLHQRVKRLDGGGGDSGRDVHFKGNELYDIYQMKYFPYRLGPVQRRQIKDSFETASALKPTSWTLILPIDLTQGEEEWFDDLVDGELFTCNWRGKTWLDAKFAERPFIAKYFLEGADAEVLDALKELNKEQAALARGLPDALDRLHALHERINQLDPYWEFDLGLVENTATLTPRPRFAGAEEESPIIINVRLAFPNNKEGQAALATWKEATEFGGAAEAADEVVEEVIIDGPGGIATSFSGGSVKMGPTAEPFSLPVRLGVQSPSNKPLAELPITFTERSGGLHGVVLSGQDRTQSMRVRLRVSLKDQRINVNVGFSPHLDALPGDLLPALRFLRVFGTPNRYSMRDAASGTPIGEPHPIPMKPLVDPEFVEIIERLAKLQELTHIHFPVPKDFTDQDFGELNDALQLLDGQPVSNTWKTMTFGLTAGGWKKAEEYLRSGEPLSFVIRQEMAAVIAGNSVPIGTVQRHLPSAEVINREEILEAIAGKSDDESVSARLRPGSDDRYEMRLVQDPEATEQSAAD